MIKHKFHAIRTEVDNIKFPSKLEAKRYTELLWLKKSKDVLFFLRQVPFHLPGNVTYRADFMVFWADGNVTIEETKGMLTKEYKMKKKMVEELYPVKITEIYK